jgi:alkylation response protein AidB-like acyl-CoA dehydrogenase
VERAREVAASDVAPHSEVWDREARWPQEGLRALQQAGLGGLVVPTRCGGLGQGHSTLLRVCEAVGEADASTGICFGMHAVGSACIAAKATPAQEAHYLDPIARGAHLTTLALSEPGTGSHFYLPETHMTARGDGDGEGFVLDGRKSFVTNGAHADSYVVSTVHHRAEAPPGHFSMVVVPGDAPGLRWGEPWRGLGMRANASRSVDLQGVPVSARDLLGQQGDEIWYTFRVVAPYFLAAMAGTYLGVANHALALTRDHMLTRRFAHTGRSIADLDLMQHRIGSLWARQQAARQVCLWATREAEMQSDGALAAVCAAKAQVAETVVHVVNECLTIAGGRAYGASSELGRLLRDARAAPVMSPTTDLLLTWAGRALLEIPILGE